MVNFGSIPFNLRETKYEHYQFLKEVNRDILSRCGKDGSSVQWNGGMNHSNVSWDMYRKPIDDYETWDRLISSAKLYESGLIKKKKVTKYI